MPGVRRDIATLQGIWNPTVLWYAKAVAFLQAKPPTDRRGWRYLGAIHGFNEQQWIDLDIIKATDPLPPDSEQDVVWQQCQHQGWYFLPWHRGYLAAFEAIVAAAVVELGGPSDWAIPYWNYLNTNDPNALVIPPAFLEAQLPDGSPNALSAAPRDDSVVLSRINLGAMNSHNYTSAQGALGFGGSQTVFQHFGGRALTGALEANPHNTVHVEVGGGPNGYMFDPNLAGLDPIFWLHHCNVDRLWAAWLTQPQNNQENGAAWSDGPSPRQFEMPDPGGNLVVFTPGETLPGGPLAPTYDDLTIGTGIGAVVAAVEDAAEERQIMPARFTTSPPPPTTLAGANDAAVTVGTQTASTTVRMNARAAEMAGDPRRQRVYLNLENVRGTAASGLLDVLISAPATGATPAAAPTAVESVALFGLRQASSPEDGHGGNGISVAIDITDIAGRLTRNAGAPLDGLVVHLQQPDGGPPITVGRVSIYRQPVE